MPFGLKNALVMFQRVMGKILRGLTIIKYFVYLNDIMVFSTSLQEHTQNLRLVFDRLRTANFQIQIHKSEFFKMNVPYLGYIVTLEGAKPNLHKILAILNYPIPGIVKQNNGSLYF